MGFRQLLVLLAGLLVMGIGPGAWAESVSVLVSIPPQACFVERIGGLRVHVEVLLPPGQSPATYTPNAVQMARIARARLYFRIGVPFETALLRRLHDVAADLEVVDTRDGIRLRSMVAHGHEGHTFGAEGAAAPDPHVWLSPKLAMTQAVTIYEALSRWDPAGEAAYRSNLQALLRDLLDLHARLSSALAPVRGKTLLVFHPAWGYFADAYGLQQQSVEVGGKEPSARDLAAIIGSARRAKAKVIFVQAQFSAKSARVVAAEVGAAVVRLDPLARDYISNMDAMAKQVAGALGDSGE